MEKIEVLNIDRSVTVAVTGHRNIKKKVDREELKEKFLYLIEKNYRVFLIGMAIGFDTLCFQILEEIRREKDIEIYACIPCVSQPDRFREEQKKEYFRMLDEADKKIYISKEYTPSCMQKRNMFMVNHASVLVAYYWQKTGGTANTVKYAMEQNVSILYV